MAAGPLLPASERQRAPLLFMVCVCVGGCHFFPQCCKPERMTRRQQELRVGCIPAARSLRAEINQSFLVTQLTPNALQNWLLTTSKVFSSCVYENAQSAAPSSLIPLRLGAGSALQLLFPPPFPSRLPRAPWLDLTEGVSDSAAFHLHSHLLQRCGIPASRLLASLKPSPFPREPRVQDKGGPGKPGR